MVCCGFHWVQVAGVGLWQVRGRQCAREEAPLLVVAPHSSFFDAIAIFCSGFPMFVSREENRHLWFVGRCIEFSQAILVSREAPESRQQAASAIRDRVCSPEAWPQTIIFPEGTCTNRTALMQFKPGAFLPGVAVQPVAIRYWVSRGQDTITWTWDQPHGLLACLLLTLTQWSTKVTLDYLPTYHPSPQEIADPQVQVYANNVRNLMAAHLGVPLCPLSFREVKHKFGVERRKDE